MKIRQVIHIHDLIYRECNSYNPFKFNGKCVFEGKVQRECLIYKLKLTLCETIYIGNTQQTLKKNGWSFILYITSTKNKQQSDLFDAH